MNARVIPASIAVCGVIALLVFGLLSKGGATIAVGDPVPDKTLPTLDGSGQGSIAEHRGDWVLVNLWASWCGPCRQEAPLLERFWRRQRSQGVVVLGIDVQDNGADALSFAREFHLTYPQLRSVGSERSKAFGTTGVPENFLVNPHGRLAMILRGPVDEQILRSQVLPLIRGGA